MTEKFFAVARLVAWGGDAFIDRRADRLPPLKRGHFLRAGETITLPLTI